MTSDVLDPLIGPDWKGWPYDAPASRLSDIAARGWNVLADDLPFPVALLRREALTHNIDWLARQTEDWGVALAPHGKTTMSPQLFRRQLDAGAWGVTFANVLQLAVGVAAGVRRALIANQVTGAADLAAIAALHRRHPDLRVIFLVDSLAQLALIEAWADQHPDAAAFEVLLEVGFAGGRTGCRDEEEALGLARRLHQSQAVQLVGIECYEGLWAQGTTEADTAWVDQMLGRVHQLAVRCEQEDLFDAQEVLVSAGGSAVFDLVAGRLKPNLLRPVRGLLRSGCYVTHDHGFYARMLTQVDARMGCACGESLRPALEVWALVQSQPEPGLAILGVGKRDLSFDMGLPRAVWHAAHGDRSAASAPAGWEITALNDQHAYLRWTPGGDVPAPVVGDRIGLGISHPCTTFDKWRWMPIVESDYRVTDAVTMHF